MIKTYLDGEQLPINPFDDLVLRSQGNNQRIEIVSLGDITKIGNRKLMEVEIKSLFSDNTYPFCASDSSHSPDHYVNLIRGRMKSRRPIRFICVGDGVDVNLQCSIENFQTTQAAGETNEVYYTLSLMEYRPPVVKRVKVLKSKTKVSAAYVTASRTEKKASSPKNHAVKYGDTLWGMAKTYYGNGALYTKIYDANRSITNNPNNIRTGQVYVIPPLEG